MLKNQQLKVFFSSLNETFTLEPLFDPEENMMYWIVEEEKERWYTLTGFEHSCMMKRNNQVFCHSALGIKIGEIV